MLTGGRALLPATPVAVVAWVLLIAATAAVVNDSRNRLRVLIYISVIGLVISLAFVQFSAPDLALTQISVEVVTILLLLLALNLLPKRPPMLSRPARKWRDGALAILGGALFGGIAWAMLTRDPGTAISAYHIANAKPGGGGTNIVNVILVDFRAFDTLGEIIVLGIAGLAIFALLDSAARGHAGARLARWQADTAHSPERHPMMLVIASRIALPLTLTAGIYLFLRGHNQPGGGFIAALVAAGALGAASVGPLPALHSRSGGERSLRGCQGPMASPCRGKLCRSLPPSQRHRTRWTFRLSKAKLFPSR